MSFRYTHSWRMGTDFGVSQSADSGDSSGGTKSKEAPFKALLTAPLKAPFTGAGRRILLYSHDTLGLGHLRRCGKISRALKHAYPDLSITIITGSPDPRPSSLPDGVDLVMLPPVRKLDDEEYVSRDPDIPFENTLAKRSQLILDAVMDFKPHLILVDHAPLGMKGEMRPTFDWLAAHAPDARVALGLRDILDDPARVRDNWRRQGVYDALEKVYHRIIIYGDPEVFDPVGEYAFPESVRAKTSFCHFVSDVGPDADGAANHNATRNGHPQRSGSDRSSVVVTIGGGDYYGREVIGTYLEMLAQYRRRVSFDSVVIAGPLMDPALLDELQRKAMSLPVTLRKSEPDMEALFRQSDLLIATGGYNTSIEALAHANRAIIIPRVTMRLEQIMRAERFASLGLLDALPPDQLTTRRLFDLITERLEQPEAPLALARERQTLKLDGAERAAEICGEILRRAPQSQEVRG
ncbi:MAG: glycosyltransferase family protein [Candidatus Zixiibacteriota bacterium]